MNQPAPFSKRQYEYFLRCMKSWFNVALSYSAIQSAGKSFGLGLKLGPLFVGTDYMFLGKNSNSVNGFVGVSIPLGGRKASKEG